MTCLSKASGSIALRGLLCGALVLLAGCSGDPAEVLLTLLSPEADAVLTAAADQDPDEPGVQVDVLGESDGLGQGTTVEVHVDGEKLGGSGKVDADGDVAVNDVTLPPGTHEIQLRTSTGSAQSETHSYTLKVMEIVAPMDGAELTALDDDDESAPGVQIDVQLESHALDTGDEVALLIDDEEVDTAMPGEEGDILFAGVTLDDGSHTLQARTGEGDDVVQSAPIQVTVESTCAEVDFISPAAPSMGDLTLGGNNACPSGDDPFEIEVEVATDAGDGQPISLFVNGNEVDAAEVEGSSATFTGVALPRRDSANTLAVAAEHSAGVTCRGEFPADIQGDCGGPDCTIDSPTPLAVTEDGDLTSFLNASMRGDDGFTVEIGTSDEGVGNSVSLIVDGRVRDALTQDAAADGTATFSALDLAQGEHTIEAQCRDAAGNITSSGEVTWTVDTVACGVDVTDPAEDTLFVDADDADGATGGVQAIATSTITGSDCTGQRAAVCDPSAGIEGVDFEAYDGTSPLDSAITLDASVIDQSLCVEIEDRAQNVGLGSVAVRYRDDADAPALLIESPDDGDRYNELGGGGFVQDEDGGTAACDADFVVACSEVGVDVELWHDTGSSPFATAPCMADASAPSGYAGRATMTAAFGDGDQSANIIARQEIAGGSGALLTGSSAEITVEGDCTPPIVTFLGDACRELGTNQFDVGEAMSWSGSLVDATADLASAAMMLTLADSSVLNESPTTTTSSTAVFGPLDVGGIGMVMVEATLTDDFDNSRTVSCSFDVVDDLPTVVLDSPGDPDSFGPGESCDTGSAGEYGVRVQATVDRAANRTASILLDTDTTDGTDAVEILSSVTVSGDASAGSIDVCVPVPDDLATPDGGSSRIVVQVNSTAGPGMAQDDALVSVQTLSIDLPTPDQVLLAGDDCIGGAGFGTSVRFTADIAHDGGTVDLSASNGGTLNGIAVNVTAGRSVTVDSGCLTIADDVDEEGANTISATVSGSSIADTVDVVVVNEAPTIGIVIDDLAEPAYDDANHRTGALATWPMPTTNWPGQLVSYEMRCRSVPLDMGETDPDKEQWWDDVIDVDGGSAESLPGGLTPDDASPSFRLGYRPLEPTHCLLRAFDLEGQPTPIVRSTNVTLSFRQQVIAVGSGAGNLGFSIAAAGDVDGDSIDDILVGGLGEGALIFGADTGFSGTPDVTFTNTSSVAAGRSVAGLGDFDGDGTADFVVGDHNYNGVQGRTILFYGRPQGSWPASINLEDSPCPGDLCIEHTEAFARSARALASAGDFDGAGQPDLMIGVPWANSFGGQALIVVADAYHRRTCVDVSDCRASGEVCDIDAGAAPGSQTYCQLDGQDFWQLVAEVPSGDWVTTFPSTPPGLRGFQVNHPTANEVFADNVVPLGQFDGSGGDDVLLPVFGTGAVHFLDGRTWSSAGAAFNVIDPLTELDLMATLGANMPNPMVALGDVFDLPGASVADKIDFGASAADTDSFVMHLGETGPDVSDAPFQASDSIFFDGPGTNIGDSMASGFDAATASVLGDVDGDGEADLCVGTRLIDRVLIWYHDELAASESAGEVEHTTAHAIPIGDSGCMAADTTCVDLDADTADLTVQYVGDVNGDGHMDIAVGDFRAESGQGRIVLIY